MVLFKDKSNIQRWYIIFLFYIVFFYFVFFLSFTKSSKIDKYLTSTQYTKCANFSKYLLVAGTVTKTNER